MNEAPQPSSPHPHAGRWEQRWHPLRREWVVYSAHRNDRPWQGETEPPPPPRPAHDPACFLCPGNTRVHGTRNPAYGGVYVFDNDHPVVGPGAPSVHAPARPAHGVARVVCYDPGHHLSVGDLAESRVLEVLQAWRAETAELGARPEIETVLVFENRGEACGTSSPHPHGQVYAVNFLMRNPGLTLEALRDDPDVFRHLLEREQDGPRIVAERNGAIAFVPHCARLPYETWVFPSRPAARITELDDAGLAQLASLYREVVRRFDRLFDQPFPYVMALHQAPTDGRPYPGFHLHLQFLPPLRAPGLRKMIAGAELGGGNYMNDAMPEDTAARLREVTP